MLVNKIQLQLKRVMFHHWSVSRYVNCITGNFDGSYWLETL